MQRLTHTLALKKGRIVLSVGGSLVAPAQGLNVSFLKNLRTLLQDQIANGWSFVLVVGGGRTARTYQETARAVGPLLRDDLDWLGIHATRLNAHLLRTVFRDHAHPIMFKDPTRVPKNAREPILVAGGWKPGWSTDYVATRIAKRLGCAWVLNLSNIDMLFDKDPHQHKDATPIPSIGWKAFRAMVGEEWDPGMNVPFDPVATRLAQKSHLNVALLRGDNLKNMKAFFEGKPFTGTLIRD